MKRAVFTAVNTVDFTADNGKKGGRVKVFLPVTRENVYRVRRLVRVYSRKGYHVHASVNHNGRLLSNVFGSDIYTTAAKRDETRAASRTIIELMERCNQEVDSAITYNDRYAFDRAKAQHSALWEALVKIDHSAAMVYRNSDDVKARAKRIRNSFYC